MFIFRYIYIKKKRFIFLGMIKSIFFLSLKGSKNFFNNKQDFRIKYTYISLFSDLRL